MTGQLEEGVFVPNKVIGISLVIGYACLMAMSDGIAKQLSTTNSVLVVVWYRYVFHLFTTLCIASWHFYKVRDNHPVGNHKLQISRGLALVFSSIFFFHSIAQMPLAEAMAVLYVFPIIAVILSVIFLKESVSLIDALFILLGFAGIILILYPSFQGNVSLAASAVIAGVLMGIYVFLTKLMSADTSPIFSSLYSGAIGAAIIPLLPDFNSNDVHLVGHDLWLGVIMGSFAALAHFGIFVAMKHAKASTLSPLTYTEIIFAAFIGLWWFGDHLTMISVLGIVLVIITGIVLSLRPTESGD